VDCPKFSVHQRTIAREGTGRKNGSVSKRGGKGSIHLKPFGEKKVRLKTEGSKETVKHNYQERTRIPLLDHTGN